MKIRFWILLIVLPYISLSQEDTAKVQNIKSVTILPRRVLTLEQTIETYSLERKDIEELQAEDVGQLLQKIPGVSMKNYGGLGGLKTFSFRSLGSQHTATVMDGFVLQNAQSGQVNLGQLQTSNLQSVSLGISKDLYQAPVSALVMANSLNIATFESKVFYDQTKIRVSVKGGSFGQSDNYFSFHKSGKKFGATIHGKYRRANGDYPYKLKVGKFDYSGVQSNNKIEEVYSGMSLFFRPNEMTQPIRLIYRNTFISQGLPGAIVLYNTTNGQSLKTENQSVMIDWKQNWGFTKVRYYGGYQYDFQQYIDSNYLNSIHFLDRKFYQNSAHIGWRFSRKKFGDLLDFYGGIEQQYAQLSIIGDTTILPQRWNTLSSAGIKINEKKYEVDMRVGYQFVNEIKSHFIQLPQRHLLSPSLRFGLKERGKFRWKSSFFTATTARLPSFNELYYAQVGNQDLLPEKVRQYTLSTGLGKAKNRISWYGNGTVYINQVEDKILAIPTKNLFVWSIQNVGKVFASGFDMAHSFTFTVNESWNTSIQANYSFQYSIDKSDPDGPTYNHQLAYTPKHTWNFDWSLKRKQTGLRLSSTIVGSRYSLNENISSNLLDPFYLLDASLTQKFILKKRNHFNFQFQVKNLLGLNYTYIRSFVMPGRNYLISLSYEF